MCEFDDKIKDLANKYNIETSKYRIINTITPEIIKGKTPNLNMLKDENFRKQFHYNYDTLKSITKGAFFAIGRTFLDLLITYPYNKKTVLLYELGILDEYYIQFRATSDTILILYCYEVSDDFIKCYTFGSFAGANDLSEIWINKESLDNRAVSFPNVYNMKYIFYAVLEYLIAVETVDLYIKELHECQGMANIYFKIAKEIYPDNVDFYTLIDDNIKNIPLSANVPFGIMIRFPELTVTNENSEKHLVKEMYVYLGIDLDGGMPIFKGIRMKLEAKEINTNYGLSHLLNGLENWGTFCTGTSDFAITNSILMEQYDVKLFEIFLFHLRIFLEWESISGGPYHRIANTILGSAIRENVLNLSKASIIVDDICNKAPKEIQTSLKAIIDDNGNGETSIKISGTTTIAEWISDMDLDTIEELFPTIDGELLKIMAITYLSNDNRPIGKLSIERAQQILNEFNTHFSFCFKDEIVESTAYLDKSLYEETYQTLMVDLSPLVKNILISRMIRRILILLSKDVKQSEIQNPKYNEIKRQNSTINEKILACSTVY